MHHKFDIDIEMTATINSTVAMQMIQEVVERQTGKAVTNIEPKYNGTSLDGYHVTFDPHTAPSAKKPAAFKPSREFILMNFDEN
jgi:hypothetical protein